ncbi:MAG: GH3 auxin-responsive promoter family protein [Lachnospiraceae bacterium]|nr:GH3 auxin-responsive promoter family protein [Lachnospiraceae bacterium]
MKFEEKLEQVEKESLWKEYCGFLDLTIPEFMQIQNRLMEEQIRLWSNSHLGKTILNGKKPESIEEFRRMVPYTDYIDYADVLLQKKSDMLPDEPIIWIQTTWEGGKHPVKVAPYTKGMLDTYKANMVGCLMLSTSSERGDFRVNADDTILYGLAPLPFATGLFPLLLNDEISIEFLPPVKEAEKMSFGERNKKGFKLGLSKGIDFFFGVASVTYFVSLSVGAMGKSSSGNKAKNILNMSPTMLYRYLKAKRVCKEENRDLKPKDLFKLKGFMCAGTDSRCYKDDLEDLWGVRPMEIFAGTEPTCIGTEIWSRNGLYFFPDACFYEFIPESEMYRAMDEPDYIPKSYLMDEVITGESYELVISVLKGGAFMRYRVGDMYRCIGIGSSTDETFLPRFEYIDRVPTVIDIGAFTRITENSIGNVIELSHLSIKDWTAAKEFSENNRPFLHLYVEMEEGCLISNAITIDVLKEHLSVYFKYLDHDYKDLKRILGIDPLMVTILKCGTFSRFERRNNRKIRRMNPLSYHIKELLRLQEEDYGLRGGSIR